MPPLLYRQQILDIVCNTSGKPYRIFVAWPENLAADDVAQAKTVYLLDANAYFQTAVETVTRCRLYGIIVGVGYPEPGPFSPRRNEDLTPPSPSYTPPISHDGTPLPETLHGDASRFLAFIQTQVVSTVEGLLQTECPHHISTLPGGLVGHSYGGLFTLYAACQKIYTLPLFDTFCPISPSIWWNDRCIMKKVKECCAKEKETVYKLRVLFSYGEYEQSPPHVTDPHVDDCNQRHARRRAMKENVMEVYKRFKEKDGLFSQAQVHEFGGETHGTVAGAGLVRALHFILDPKNIVFG
ncbi:Alpha/Beta hydrolase protein [Armillaria novae-zelandiae]|uniref:Alpha/Beta hydrolase protein n=1 Tax=Armillaria novae-zelandiae TaxID=153914 RepID=A0AA39PPV9_9AGAR|nr:Alpha/Beta hydrolase protein [Armillaria novae-zelandiae]